MNPPADGARRRPGRGPGAQLSRRAFLAGSAGAALAMAAFAGCADPDSPTVGGGPAPLLASPDNPVTWPIPDDNQPIASGLQPEQDATLKLYNWEEYINADVVKAFEKAHRRWNTKVKVTTFKTMAEALDRLRAGGVDDDVFFPTYDVVGKVVQAGWLRPLNHSYVPNITNTWPVFQNPFYDQDWRYSVPYTVYTTGISWRVDRITEDVDLRPNPYEVLWDQRYRGRAGILDDYREAIGLVLQKNGIDDLNTDSPRHLELVKQDLLGLKRSMQPVISVDAYKELPASRTWVTQAWSGDMINAQYYMPKGQSPEVIRYWYPLDGRGAIANDLITVLRAGSNPVLAHRFVNFMLDYKVAMQNMEWNGYQPPQTRVDPDSLVRDELVLPTLKSVVVRQEYFETGYRQLELSPSVDARWQAVWEAFKAGT